VQAGASQLPLFITHQGFKPSLIKYLDSSQTIYGLNYGMAQQDNKNLRLPKKIEDLASHYVEEIRALQSQGPYLLMGSSFGGLVAFEVAQQLIKAKQEIALLLLVDTGFYQKTIWQEKLTNLSNKNIKEIINKFIKKIHHKRLENKQKNTLTVPDLLMTKRYYLLQKYQPKIYPYKITLLRVTEQLEENSFDLGWRKFEEFPGLDVQILPIPGNHGTMFLEPNVQIMAKQINACLDKVFEGL
jgi:aspartate racemase